MSNFWWGVAAPFIVIIGGAAAIWLVTLMWRTVDKFWDSRWIAILKHPQASRGHGWYIKSSDFAAAVALASRGRRLLLGGNSYLMWVQIPPRAFPGRGTKEYARLQSVIDRELWDIRDAIKEDQ